MEAFANVFKVSIPNYFANLPLPTSLAGATQLSIRDWLSLIPAVGGFAFVAYATAQVYQEKKPVLLKFLHEKGLIAAPAPVKAPCGRCNDLIQMDCSKVVDKEMPLYYSPRIMKEN